MLTSELTRKLRQYDGNSEFGKPHLIEAADRIEKMETALASQHDMVVHALATVQQQEAEIERLRTELGWIRDNAHMGSRDIRQRAEAALEGGEPVPNSEE